MQFQALADGALFSGVQIATIRALSPVTRPRFRIPKPFPEDVAFPTEGPRLQFHLELCAAVCRRLVQGGLQLGYLLLGQGPVAIHLDELHIAGACR